MSSDDAIVKVIMDMFGDSGMLTYYGNLQDKNGAREMEERKQRIHTSPNSMCKYYCDLNLANKSSIYDSMLSDYYRVIISRWRLSNHRLNIETGRYTRPMTERSKRVCTMCDVVEDEQHVIYECPRYGEIRNNYEHLTNGGDISNFLNPEYGNMMDTAKFIYDIESKRDDLKL